MITGIDFPPFFKEAVDASSTETTFKPLYPSLLGFLLSLIQNSPEAVALFQGLWGDEEKHKSSLFEIYQRLSGKESDPGFPQALVSLEPGDDYLEGGIGLKTALEWSRGKDLKDILEFSMSLEVNAIDLYINATLEGNAQEFRVPDMFPNPDKEYLDQEFRDSLEYGTGEKLFSVADLSKVWVELSVFEKDIASVKPGDSVSLKCPIHPGMTFKGTVELTGGTSRSPCARWAGTALGENTRVVSSCGMT